MSKILITGIITLDIIHYQNHYPQEDSEQRASRQLFETGGNSANSGYILKQLGHEPKLAASLADDPSSQFIREQLKQRDIDYFKQWQTANSQSPTSCILINQQNGSRTISHYRSLPELTFKQFDSIALETFDWLHFEGRNINALEQMLKKACQQPSPVSLEVEKDRHNIDALFPHADIIFFSKTFARQRGFASAELCLQHFSARYPDKTLLCAWGELGAWAWQSAELQHAAACPPEKLLDTRAAGDTFNAACIDGLLEQKSLARILEDACQLAGQKCGQLGLENLINTVNQSQDTLNHV